jgi:ubiquinone/menaquinone biosynthesis C-methylase UbiE
MSGSNLLQKVSHSFHFRDYHKQVAGAMAVPLNEYSLALEIIRYIPTLDDVRRMLEATFNKAYRIEDIYIYEKLDGGSSSRCG